MRDTNDPDTTGSNWALYFGGPGKPRGNLRGVLAEKIDAQKIGDEIIWATYYFCDLDLAKRLMLAWERGVKIRLVLQETPRFPTANQPVIDLLKSHPIWDHVTLYRPPSKLSGNLHSKVYVFKDSQPSAFIGSFNPSGDGAGNRELISRIGEQDGGYNLLLELREPKLVQFLASLVLDIGKRNGAFWRRVQGQRIEGRLGTLTTFPHLAPFQSIKQELWPQGTEAKGAKIRMAASHVKGRLLYRLLKPAFLHQGDVSLLTHHTQRRAPDRTLDLFRRAGAKVKRYVSSENLPMHAKFILVETSKGGPRLRLGSLNYNPKSLWLNDELIFDSRDPDLYAALADWFDRIWESTAN